MSSDNFSIDQVKHFFEPENLKNFFKPDNLKAFATRAWHGELPLWQAFWGLTVLPNILINFVTRIIAALIPIPSFLVILGILVFLITLPLTILQLVSVWRSAVNYNTANPSVYWGYAAQALVALGGLMLAVGLVGTIFRH